MTRQPWFQKLAETLIKFICAAENNWCLVGLHLDATYWSEKVMKHDAAPGEQLGLYGKTEKQGNLKCN